MNRHFASPKGYSAYPRGPSTFSISPNRYVRNGHAHLYLTRHADDNGRTSMEERESDTDLNAMLDSNLAPNRPSDVDDNSSNGSAFSVGPPFYW